MKGRSGIRLAAALLCLLTQAAWADDSPPASSSTSSTDGKKFGLDVRFDYLIHRDLGFFGYNYPLAPTYNSSASFTQTRLLGGFEFRPVSGVELTLLGGVSIAGSLTATEALTTGTTVSQTMVFDNAPTVGMQLALNLLPSIRFHITPQFRWLHTEYQGTHGSLSNNNGACTYDFATNNSSACVSLGGNTGGGNIATHFVETSFRAGLELSVDILGDIGTPTLGIFASAFEENTIYTGGATFTQPLGAGVGSEGYTFTLQRTWGAIVGLATAIGPVKITGEFEGYTQLLASMNVGINF